MRESGITTGMDGYTGSADRNAGAQQSVNSMKWVIRS